MADAENPAPGFRDRPEHRITIRPFAGDVTVTANGRTIAATRKALSLAEHTYPPVLYIPLADIDFTALSPTETSTYCPFKGNASYWSVREGAADAMWAYRQPYDEMLAIKDHGAFYPDRVTIEKTEG